MPSATSSGADAGQPNGGAARSRDHNQGNQDRKYTEEQKAAVIRVRKCGHTAFYEILAIEKTAPEKEIKKAYRKLSLLTHPDKNGYDGADEAFKMVSRAFQILSDQDKKSKYDKFGGDPDSRFGAGPSASSPFSGFARSSGAGRGPMFEDELSPEELFAKFFGGGMGGMNGGMFGDPFGGGQFVFNLGGGPGIRVHQFGGGRPRRRPAGGNATAQQPQTLSSMIMNLLPLVVLFVLPLLSSLFGAATTPSTPTYRFEVASPPYTLHRVTPRYKVDYYLNPSETLDYSARKLSTLDHTVERNWVVQMQGQCQREASQQYMMRQDAQNWFSVDQEKMRQANALPLTSCKRLQKLGIPLRD